MRLTSLFHPSHPRGGHPPHSNLVRGKLTSPTPTLQETGLTVLRPIREDEEILRFPQYKTKHSWVTNISGLNHAAYWFINI